MSSPHTATTGRGPTPLRPDIDLIDNLEGNERILNEDREAAQRYLDELDEQERNGGQR